MLLVPKGADGSGERILWRVPRLLLAVVLACSLALPAPGLAYAREGDGVTASSEVLPNEGAMQGPAFEQDDASSLETSSDSEGKPAGDAPDVRDGLRQELSNTPESIQGQPLDALGLQDDPANDAENDQTGESESRGSVDEKAAVDSVLPQEVPEAPEPAVADDLGGTARNLVLLVRFAGDTMGDGETGYNAPHVKYGTMWEYLITSFNESDHTAYTGWGFRNYLYEVSKGQHDVVTDFPQTQQDGRVAYITLDQKASDFGENRDLEFLRAVMDKFNGMYGSYDAGRVDLDADGVVDNVLVVPVVVSPNEATPFFNHKAYASDPALKIGSGSGERTVNVYNIVPATGDGSSSGGPSLDWGVAVHEYLHTLGAKDYYRDSGVGSPVGVWDIMASSGSRSRPLAVTREELGWTTIPEKGEGTFTLTSAWSQDGQAIMFKSPLNDTEYFVAEYRKKGEPVKDLDSKIGGSGLLVYRVNPSFADEGNIEGNDYAYVFRPGETGLGDSYAGENARNLVNAQVAVSGYATELARSSVGTPDLSADITQGALCYSNGQNSGIVIKATAQTDDSITFNITYPDYTTADLWDVVANADGSSSMLGSGVSGIQLATDGPSLYAALRLRGSHQVMKYDGTAWASLGIAVQNAYATQIAAADGDVYVLAALDDGKGTVVLRKHDGAAWRDTAAIRLGTDVFSNQLAVGFVQGSLYVLAGANDGAVRLYRLEGASLNVVSDALPIGDIAHPELFDLNGNPAVACGEPGAGKSHVFELTSAGWTSRSSLAGGSSNVNSVAVGDGKTYVYQCLDKGMQATPKLLVFDGAGSRSQVVDVPKLAATYLEGSLDYANGALYLSLCDGQEAKTYTADVDNLGNWTMLGGVVYTPAAALSSAVFEGRIHVGVVNPTSEQATVRSHALAGEAPVPPSVHKAVFRVDGSAYKEVTFREGDTRLVEPAVPAKTGFTGTWSKYQLGSADLVIDAVYVPNSYKITFVNWDGGTLQAARSYSFGGRVSAPANPKRPDSGGYRYAFAGWSPSFSGSCDQARDMVYRAQFTKKAIEHTVTFVAEGVTVAKLRFNEVDRKPIGTVPAVPSKPGYTGAWESYKLGSGDVTVRAIYTACSVGWYKEASTWRYVDRSGHVKTGWLLLGGSWYYLDPARQGAMLTGSFRVAGTLYHARSSGALVTGRGWTYADGAWFYVSPSGAVRTGWLNDRGTWYWLDPSKGSMATGWYQVGSTWYYSNASGAMQTGWMKQGATWYYLKGSGAMATGWAKVSGTWYYLNGSGAMATGWRQVGSAWYYLDGSGAMRTGWLRLGSTWYYLYGSGAMASNAWIGNYYVGASGAMAASTWVGRYYVGPDGAWRPGWTRG